MSSDFQTVAALAVVGLTVAWFAWRARARRRDGGCGSGCGGCESADLKAKLKR